MLSAVLIAGATASGKSAFALDVARAIDGVIVNADSMQVYSDLRVLSARPTKAEMKGIDHHLYGHVDGAQHYSVGHWTSDAVALRESLPPGTPLVFVGGTGLYFRALLEGISPIPHVDDAIRKRWRLGADHVATKELHNKLLDLDPLAANEIRDTDRQRVLRAIEVFEATGRSILEWQREPRQPAMSKDGVRSVFLDAERSALYQRVDQRFDEMMEEGALDEVRAILARGLSPEMPVMRAHGVPHLAAYLANQIDLDTALTRSKADVRHYAKRQKTWYRNQMAGAVGDWETLDPADQIACTRWIAGLAAHST